MTATARFRVDPRLATLLAEGYRSSEQAIKELVDNAWDADAENVSITLPGIVSDEPITIGDNGSGMTEQELRAEYMNIASGRRSRRGDRSAKKNRVVKGRKGIGKFAGFMAANLMQVDTRAGGVATRLILPKSALLQAARDLEEIELPIEIGACDREEHGTTITLYELNQSFSIPSAEKLKRLLVTEYGREADFAILVNGEPLDLTDLAGTQYEKTVDIPGVGPVRLRLTITDEKRGFKDSGIAIRVAGKIIGAPSHFGLDKLEEIPSKLLKKVYGEIEADGLAEAVTADGGALIENSKAYEALSAWVQSETRSQVEKVFHREVNLARARLTQALHRRIATLPEHRRPFAQVAIEKILRRFYLDGEERIAAVLSVMLDAFEVEDYWLVIRELDAADINDVSTLAQALEKFGLLDTAAMANHAQARLRFLEKLDTLIADPRTLEREVHVAFEHNVWLLGIEYSLMASNQTLGRIIEEYKSKEFKGDRANKRPDLLLMQDVADRVLLVEFKRPSHSITREDELQAVRYRDDLSRHFWGSTIEVLLIGKETSRELSPMYASSNLQILSYSAIVGRARQRLNWTIKELVHADEPELGAH
jgi:hypothetical protein